MGWKRFSRDWAYWTIFVRERWARLTDDQLLLIATQPEELAGCIQKAYGLSRAEVERQLRNWERNHAFEIEESKLDDEETTRIRVA